MVTTTNLIFATLLAKALISWVTIQIIRKGKKMSMELDIESLKHGKELVKRGFARMQKGGVIMDVVNAEQADVAEKAGAVAVMALERVPSDIRADGGVARMSNPTMITEIVDCTSIPVMAKCRIGHTAEARVLEALGVAMIG